jgi:hypothetical protein
MKIDANVRRVTRPGTNLFLELGFGTAEARRLQAASRKQIRDLLRLRKRKAR